MSDPTALPNFAPPPDEHPLRGRVLDVLLDLGLAPNIDSDGDVEFVYQDQHMFARCSDGDWPLLRVFGQWQIQDPAPTDQFLRLQRCNDISLQLNVVKVGVANDSLVATSEHIIHPGTDLKALMALTLDLVLQAVGVWFQSWVPGEPEESAG